MSNNSASLGAISEILQHLPTGAYELSLSSVRRTLKKKVATLSLSEQSSSTSISTIRLWRKTFHATFRDCITKSTKDFTAIVGIADSDRGFCLKKLSAACSPFHLILCSLLYLNTNKFFAYESRSPTVMIS